ncbi:histidine kinase [Streptomyces sp. NPDC093707]|uniref:sensor histidine kinase n=1 Tax=Streptomyces sp. NPDC093707 TaxID=3154984 RepID=UPI00344F5A75
MSRSLSIPLSRSAWWRPVAEALAALAVLGATAGVLEWSLAWGFRGAGELLVGLAGVVLVVLRRWFPAVALLGLSATAGAVPAVALLTAVAACEAGRRAGELRWPGVVLGAASLLPLATAPYRAPSPEQIVPLGMVVAVLAVVGPVLVGVATGQQDRAVRILRDSALAADSRARLAERSRIAAEMHDLVGHRLSLISLYSGGLELALARREPSLRTEAAQIHTTAALAVVELQEVLGVLGPIDDTGPTEATGTRADLADLAAASRATGTTVLLEWTGDDLAGSPPRLRLAVHRIVREALSNAHRHAPGAALEIRVVSTRDHVRVSVHNGPSQAGADSSGTGLGLAGLRERVALLGGTLEARSTGGGFAVDACLPRLLPLHLPAPPQSPAPALTRPSRTLRLAAGAAGLLAVGGLLLLGLRLVDRYAPPPVPLTKPMPIRLGMSQETVEHRAGTDDPLARAAAAGRESRPPAGAHCIYPYVSQERPGVPLHLVRYCFRDDRLIDISRFDIPAGSR